MDAVITNRAGVCGVVIVVSLLSACASSSSMLGKCPQPRFTEKAPEPVYSLKNTLQNTVNAIEAGKKLYQEDAGQVPCARCHGREGNGLGTMAKMFDPPPRNFRCAKTIQGVPDGQLFWIIKNGSPETSMPAFDHLSDEQIWQLVHYIRKLALEATL